MLKDTKTVVVGGFGPHMRLKGNGSVKLVTGNKIVTVPLNEDTEVKFTRLNLRQQPQEQHAA